MAGGLERGVVGFGALNLDVIYNVDKIPSADEEGFIKNVSYHPGGSAANTIVALSRVGVKTAYIGKVGNDDAAEILLQDFESEGVDTRFVIRSDGRSGKAIILVDDDGNRAILVDPGVNDTIKLTELNLDEVTEYGHIHLTSFICKNGLESFYSQKRIVSEFESVSFDPGMIYVERGLDELMDILKRTTVFLPNKAEIEMLFGTDYITAAEECISLGIDVVAVKMGGEGCWIKTRDGEVKVEPLKVEVVDTTGAGDAFNAGFLYAYLSGMDIERCGKLGNYFAAMCIGKYGARDGLPREVRV